MANQKYPVGIETFSELIEEGYVYVDKTEYIHRLIERGKYYFLSRPRRFGKSLLLSTIKSFFEGRRNLFKNLAIDQYPYDWEPHPVFHLNFVNANTSSIEGLHSILIAQISKWERQYGRDESEIDLSQRFYGVIERAVAATGHKAVVLIDEYDKFLVATIDNPDLNRIFRDTLKPIYGTLKAADSFIRFAMLTGVTRFSRLSVFSDMNNLRDISLNNDFAAICGITESEIRHFLSPGVERIAKKLDISFEEAFSRLKQNYDGYHFTSDRTDLYNPFSLLYALEDSKIGDYWFASGTPTFLLEALRSRVGNIRDFFNSEIDDASLGEIESYSDDPTALLFQTGYLTIKGVSEENGDYLLRLPNEEVGRGIFKGILPIFSGMGKDESRNFIRTFTREVKSGNAETFMQLLKSFLSDIPYDLSKNKPEVYFENNIYIICKLLGMEIQTEYRTSHGRIDILMKTDKFIYVIELKLNGTATSAMNQIESKEYTLPFATDGRQIIKIGIGFSKRTRNISRWLISR